MKLSGIRTMDNFNTYNYDYFKDVYIVNKTEF